MREVPFDITQAYLNLRKRHARECQDFVVCTAFMKPQVQLQKLVDTTTAWIHKNRTVLPEYAIASIKQHVRNYVDLTFRKEVPKARPRIEKEQANNLALAVLEFSALQCGSGAGKNHKQKISKHGALAFFVKQYPDLADKYNLIIKKARPDPKPSSDTKPSTRARSSSSSKSKRSSQRSSRQPSRSTSRASAKSTSTPKGKGKAKGKGKGKDSGQFKGKGKGKGKDHHSKNKSVSFRSQTPGRSRH